MSRPNLRKTKKSGHPPGHPAPPRLPHRSPSSSLQNSATKHPPKPAQTHPTPSSQSVVLPANSAASIHQTPPHPPPNPPFPPRGPPHPRHPTPHHRPLKPAPPPSPQSSLASKHPPRPGNHPRPHARTTASSRDGIATSTSTKLARVAATAAQSAKFKDAAMTGPATADPTGFPTEFNDIDTAKARPNHAWSVRLSLTVNKPMSKRPAERPSSTNAPATTQTLETTSTSTQATVATRIGPAMNHRSRP